MSERRITVIEATLNPMTRMPVVAPRKRRVAGYARVSTDHDEQFTSYEAQVDYYTRFIKSKPEWEFVKVYTPFRFAFRLNTKDVRKYHSRLVFLLSVLNHHLYLLCR